MRHNQYPGKPNQNQQQGAEQAPAPLSGDEFKALSLRLQQRLRQAQADPSGGHALKPGEVLPAGYQDTYGNNQQVVGRFIGFEANDRGEQVPVFQRHVAEASPSPAPQPPRPVQNPYPQPQVVPRPQPPQPGNQYPYPQGQYPQQPYQGQNQYPQPPMYPGQHALSPVSPPRFEQPQPPQVPRYETSGSWGVSAAPEVPAGGFGPQPEVNEETVGLGPTYQSYFVKPGEDMSELGGTETHVEAVNGVIGQKGEHGDDRFITPELRQDDMEAERARVAAEAAAKAAQQPPQNPNQ